MGREDSWEKIIGAAWRCRGTIAAAIDVRVPGAEGKTTGQTTRLMQCYLDRVTRLLPTKEQAERAFLESAHFVAPPRALFAPAIVARALTLPPGPNTYSAPKKPLAH